MTIAAAPVLSTLMSGAHLQDLERKIHSPHPPDSNQQIRQRVECFEDGKGVSNEEHLGQFLSHVFTLHGTFRNSPGWQILACGLWSQCVWFCQPGQPLAKSEMGNITYPPCDSVSPSVNWRQYHPLCKVTGALNETTHAKAVTFQHECPSLLPCSATAPTLPLLL